jgi:sulfonate transport system substrate-binding protein
VAVAGAGLWATLPAGATAKASGVKVATKVPSGTTLRVADQFEGTQLPLQLSGQLTKLPFTVQWSEFVGGPGVIQALEANAVDLGVLGDVPLVYPQASGNDLVAVAATQSSGKTSGIVSAPGEDLTSVGQLKGKKVAYTASTAPQGFLYSALQKAGVKGVTLIDIATQSDVTSALESDSVDAAALTYPLISNYLVANPTAHLVERSNLNIVSGYSYFVTTKAVLADPAKAAAIGQFLKGFVTANAWRNAHPAQWVTAYYIGEEKLPPDVAQATNTLNGSTAFVPITAAVIAKQQRVADLLAANKAIPEKVDASAEFDNRFNGIIRQALASLAPAPTSGGAGA